MKINLNGEHKDIENACTIAELTTSLELSQSQFAVEVNGAIVPKAAHTTTPLNDGDNVEIVRFIGGG